MGQATRRARRTPDRYGRGQGHKWHPAWLCAVLLSAALAHADNVDTLIGQLNDGSEKVRLSAALSLTKLGDARAIAPFAIALAKDGDKNVRATVAVGLSKLVGPQTKPAVRTQVVAALTAAQKDASEFVRKQAEKSLATVKALDGGGSGAGGDVPQGVVYLEVGPMAHKNAEGSTDFKALMRETTQKTLKRTAREMLTAWPGGKAPTAAQLSAKGAQAFYIDGTINELVHRDKGGVSMVTCKVNMLIATFPDKSMFGFLNGGASVEAGTSGDDIESAKKDCIDAVVDDLVAKKIVPTIKTKAGL